MSLITFAFFKVIHTLANIDPGPGLIPSLMTVIYKQNPNDPANMHCYHLVKQISCK